MRGIIICITFVAMIASYYKISETNNWVTVDLFANRAYFTDLQVLINYTSGEITIVDYKGEVAECNPEQIDLFITP